MKRISGQSLEFLSLTSVRGWVGWRWLEVGCTRILHPPHFQLRPKRTRSKPTKSKLNRWKPAEHYELLSEHIRGEYWKLLLISSTSHQTYWLWLDDRQWLAKINWNDPNPSIKINEVKSFLPKAVINDFHNKNNNSFRIERNSSRKIHNILEYFIKINRKPQQIPSKDAKTISNECHMNVRKVKLTARDGSILGIKNREKR